eukprot:1760518-Prymnesium_polylepis.2
MPASRPGGHDASGTRAGPSAGLASPKHSAGVSVNISVAPTAASDGIRLCKPGMNPPAPTTSDTSPWSKTASGPVKGSLVAASARESVSYTHLRAHETLMNL